MQTASRELLVVPQPIQESRVAKLVALGIERKFAEIDLEMVKIKLQQPSEGLAWSPAQCEDGEVEYKRYLTLCSHYPYPRYSIVPSKIMDTVWHYHILDTRAYVRDCERAFGHYFHHFPYFGLRGEEDERRLKAAFQQTKELYARLFGEPMARNREADCWHDCEDRCWHACSEND